MKTHKHTQTSLLLLLWLTALAYDAPRATATPVHVESMQDSTATSLLHPQASSSDSTLVSHSPGVSSVAGRTPLGLINEKGGGVTFADDEIQAQVLALYAATNEDGSFIYAPFRVQVDELHRSDIVFEVSLGRTAPGTAGETRTDGHKVLLIINPDGAGSLIARLAHECAHGQQVNRGDLGFRLIEGAWRTDPLTQDIYDEVDAYQTQLEVALGTDFWRRGGRRSLLGQFADATTRDEQARMLLGFRTADGDRIYVALENRSEPRSYPPSPTDDRIVLRRKAFFYVHPASGKHAAQGALTENP